MEAPGHAAIGQLSKKSLIASVAEPVMKVRPIVTHSRMALKRVARPLAAGLRGSAAGAGEAS